MKMIRAIIRPEKEEEVIKSLDKSGFPSVTKMDILGRGKQKGIQIGNVAYEELAKTMIIVVVDDLRLNDATQAIISAAKTGNYGDGKIFITPVENAITIRTGRSGL